jgi:hypothetical protein
MSQLLASNYLPLVVDSKNQKDSKAARRPLAAKPLQS